MSKTNNTTVVFGGHGFVGSTFLRSVKNLGRLLIPSIDELDLTNREQLSKYLDLHQTNKIVNLVAYTNLDQAEKERGDQKGVAWRTNVETVRNLVDLAQRRNLYLVHISTDAVFPGTKDHSGPYKESMVPPNTDQNLSWYGYTKLQGEIEAQKHENVAILRIAYPFGGQLPEKDFALKTVKYLRLGYPLFFDQQFTPSYLLDVAETIRILLSTGQTGGFHCTCQGLTTPFHFGEYIQTHFGDQLGLNSKVEPGSAVEFISSPGRPARPILGGLDTKETQKRLGLQFKSWQQALDEFIPEIVSLNP